MANILTQKPIRIDTDITTFRNAAAVTALGWKQGIRVTKLVLSVAHGSASSAGIVTITDPNGATLYPTMPVAASIAADSVLVTDEPTNAKGDLTWRDFAVTGVTATGTVLWLWYDV